MEVDSSVYIYIFVIYREKKNYAAVPPQTSSACIYLKIDKYCCLLRVQGKSPQPCSESIWFLSSPLWLFKNPTRQ